MRSVAKLTERWGVSKEPLVSICCITYNHERYIAQALDSFFMQETDFPFEIVIHDDASTDNTANIIRKYEKQYPGIINPIYQTENQKSKYKSGMNPRFNYPRAKGKYIALCDGDDYWTDPLKLQKQVDFMEKNEEFGALFSDYNLLNATTGKIIFNINKLRKKNIPSGYVADKLIVSNPYTTCTVMFRAKLSRTYCCKIYPLLPLFRIGDLPLWLYIARFHKIGYITDATATYRRNEVSASHFTTTSAFITYGRSNYKMKLFFSDFFNIPFDKYAYKRTFRRKVIKFLWNSKLYKEGFRLCVKNIRSRFL